MRHSEAGFTLVELLTVMLMLVLLAGIAIPSYLNQRDKALDAEAKADVRAAQTAAIEVALTNDGRFNGPGGISVRSLSLAEPGLADAQLETPVRRPDVFTVRVQSKTGNTFDITRHSDGTTELTCATAGRGGCPPDGRWG